VFQKHITPLFWTLAASQTTTLFQGVESFHNLKVGKQHLFKNQFLLKELLQLNDTGSFSKAVIAKAFETLDEQGAMRKKY
jgi:hypothetical protein